MKKVKFNLIGSLGNYCTEDSPYLHISKYMEIKELKISFELGISLSIGSMRLIKTLTEGYAAVYMILDKSKICLMWDLHLAVINHLFTEDCRNTSLID